MKLVALEAESSVLRSACADHGMLASSLALTEVPRALRRRDPEPVWSAGWVDLLRRLRLVDLDRRLLSRAGRLPPTGLRSLDAVHLATALSIPGLDAFVGYDARLQSCAAAAGLLPLSPGAA